MNNEQSHVFFVNAVPYRTGQPTMSGAEIKWISNMVSTYQLYEESEDVETFGVPISDGTAIDFRINNVRHFFAIPPATW